MGQRWRYSHISAQMATDSVCASSGASSFQEALRLFQRRTDPWWLVTFLGVPFTHQSLGV